MFVKFLFMVVVVLSVMPVATAEPEDVQAQQDRAEALARRTQQIDRAAATGRISPREAEFMKLMQNRGNDPRAHREAVRAWQQKHGAALKAERDARHAASKPRRDVSRAQALIRRNQQIDRAVTSGHIGHLEAEFQKLRMNHGSDLAAHRKIVAKWYKQKGQALKQERKARLQGDRAEADRKRAEAKRKRSQMIDRAEASGRLGPREAEFMKLMQNRGNDPRAHREAVRAWLQTNGTALKAERKTRKNQNRITRP